jgi:hypothetical protein
MGIQNSLAGKCLAVLVLAVALAASAYGQSDKMDGVYANANGQNAIEFRGDKAFLTMVGMASDALPYDVKGNTITVHAGGIAGDLVLTRNSDGTLESPLGLMRKKTS